MGPTRINLLPQQMVPDSIKKSEKWQKENIDAFETLILFENRHLRPTFYNKITNYNLKRGILDINDVKYSCDSQGINMDTYPARMQHIGIGNNKINVLIGEHAKRNFDCRVVVSNPDGVSRKEKIKIEKYKEFFIEQLKNESLDENDFKRKLIDVKDYLDYEWQDVAELGANKIMKWTYKQQEMEDKFNRTFEDALIGGEQYMIMDDLSNELQVRKGDPLRIFTLMSSDAIDERGLEAFVEVKYYTISSVLDLFYDKLKPDDVDKLNGYTSLGATSIYSSMTYPLYGHVGELNPNNLYNLNELEKSYFAANFDANNNIRVLTVFWRSKRKIKKIKIINELGLEEYEYKHEKYKISADRGESLEKELWVNEWWKGYKIGNDVYCGIEPIPFLSTSMENICNQSAPIVMQLYNTNSNKAQSLMDVIKPLDYLYDIFSYKREGLINKLKGDVLTFNTSMIPDNMTMEEFMNYMETTGVLPLDPTAEIISGSQAGRAAGQFNNTTRTEIISSNQGGPISVLSEIMQDVIRTMDMVSGVTQQREGSISSSELVGNVQRSVTQSSHSTEKWFNINDRFKRRVMQQTLERQLNLLMKNPRKLTYILDDYTTGILTDEEISATFLSEFDLHVSNSTKDAELMQKIEVASERALQAGTLMISDLLDIYKNDSISAAIRKLKKKEQERSEQAQQAQQMQSEIAQQAQQQESAFKEAELEYKYAELEMKKYEIDTEAEVKLQIAAITSYIGQKDMDQDDNGIVDPIELSKLGLEQLKVQQGIMDKEMDRSNKLAVEEKKKEQIEIQNKNQEKLKQMDIKLKEREMKSKEKIERMKNRNKPKPSKK